MGTLLGDRAWREQESVAHLVKGVHALELASLLEVMLDLVQSVSKELHQPSASRIFRFRLRIGP